MKIHVTITCALCHQPVAMTMQIVGGTRIDESGHVQAVLTIAHVCSPTKTTIR